MLKHEQVKNKERKITLCGVPCSVTHIPEKNIGLSLLYHTVPGRAVLKMLTVPAVSIAAGRFLDRPDSRWIIPAFSKLNHIDLDEFELSNAQDYQDFNEFFCRKVRGDLRPVCEDPNKLASPCDGLLRIYPIQDGLVIPVKESRYSMVSLLRNLELADTYEGGYCLVFRLCVNHYHRYHFPDDGCLGEYKRIPGVLHTVQPVALSELPVFTENNREYTVLHTEHFGDIVQMEVGAMLVGRIVNRLCGRSFERGEEKGYFQYGGSTVILLIQKNQIHMPAKVLKAAELGYEIHVKMGQPIAEK